MRVCGVLPHSSRVLVLSPRFDRRTPKEQQRKSGKRCEEQRSSTAGQSNWNRRQSVPTAWGLGIKCDEWSPKSAVV